MLVPHTTQNKHLFSLNNRFFVPTDVDDANPKALYIPKNRSRKLTTVLTNASKIMKVVLIALLVASTAVRFCYYLARNCFK